MTPVVTRTKPKSNRATIDRPRIYASAFRQTRKCALLALGVHRDLALRRGDRALGHDLTEGDPTVLADRLARRAGASGAPVAEGVLHGRRPSPEW